MSFYRWAFTVLFFPGRAWPPNPHYQQATFCARWKLVKQRRSIKGNL